MTWPVAVVLIVQSLGLLALTGLIVWRSPAAKLADTVAHLARLVVADGDARKAAVLESVVAEATRVTREAAEPRPAPQRPLVD